MDFAPGITAVAELDSYHGAGVRSQLHSRRLPLPMTRPASNPARRASLLSDPTARVAEAFGLLVAPGAGPSGHSSHVQPADERFPHGSLLIPATYVLDQRGQIVYACACLSRCKTADPTEILGVLRFLHTGYATHQPVSGE
jgi:hypothetical protein